MKVSIITVCMNSEGTIQDTLLSVSRQTHPELEHIIFDGGSTDDTVEIIELNISSNSRLITGRDSGIYDAMNKAVGFCTGDILLFLNSDDMLVDENVVSNVVRQFQDTGAHILCAGIKYFDRDPGTKIVRTWMPKEFSKGRIASGWHPPHPGFFCRTSIFRELGGFNTVYRIVADFDFMIRACSAYHNNVHISDLVATYMRVGGASDGGLTSTIRNNLDVCDSLKANGFKVSKIVYIIKRLLSKALQKI